MAFRSKTAWLLFAFCLIGTAIAVGAEQPADKHDADVPAVTGEAASETQTKRQRTDDKSAAPQAVKLEDLYKDLLGQFTKADAQYKDPDEDFDTDTQTDLDCSADHIADLTTVLKCFLIVKDDPIKNKALLEALRKQKPELVDDFLTKLQQLKHYGDDLKNPTNADSKSEFDLAMVGKFNLRMFNTLDLFNRKPEQIVTKPTIVPGPFRPRIAAIPFAKPDPAPGAGGDPSKTPAGPKPGQNAGTTKPDPFVGPDPDPNFTIASAPTEKPLETTTHEAPANKPAPTGTGSTSNPGGGSTSPGGNTASPADGQPAPPAGSSTLGQFFTDAAHGVASVARNIPVVGSAVGDTIDAVTNYFQFALDRAPRPWGTRRGRRDNASGYGGKQSFRYSNWAGSFGRSSSRETDGPSGSTPDATSDSASGAAARSAAFNDCRDHAAVRTHTESNGSDYQCTRIVGNRTANDSA